MTLQQTIAPAAASADLNDAVEAYGRVQAAITDGANFNTELKEAMALAKASEAGEADTIAALRRHLVGDLERAADGAASVQATATELKTVNVAALTGLQQASAKQIVRDFGLEPVEEGGDIAIDAFDTLAETLATAAKAASPGASLPKAPRVNVPGLFTTDMVDGIDHSYGGIMSGGLLTLEGPEGPRQVRLVAGRMHYGFRYRKRTETTTHVGLLAMPMIQGSFGPEVSPSPLAPMSKSAQQFLFSSKGYDGFMKKTEYGRYMGWSQHSGHEKHGHANFVTVLRTLDFTGRFAPVSTYRSSKSLGKKVPLQRHPSADAPLKVVDPVQAHSPFNAYYAPEVTPADDLVVYSSPYLKIVSGGPGSGPSIVMFLQGRRAISEGRIKLEEYIHAHRVMFF